MFKIFLAFCLVFTSSFSAFAEESTSAQILAKEASKQDVQDVERLLGLIGQAVINLEKGEMSSAIPFFRSAFEKQMDEAMDYIVEIFERKDRDRMQAVLNTTLIQVYNLSEWSSLNDEKKQYFFKLITEQFNELAITDRYDIVYIAGGAIAGAVLMLMIPTKEPTAHGRGILAGFQFIAGLIVGSVAGGVFVDYLESPEDKNLVRVITTQEDEDLLNY